MTEFEMKDLKPAQKMIERRKNAIRNLLKRTRSYVFYKKSVLPTQLDAWNLLDKYANPMKSEPAEKLPAFEEIWKDKKIGDSILIESLIKKYRFTSTNIKQLQREWYDDYGYIVVEECCFTPENCLTWWDISLEGARSSLFLD